MSAPKTIRKVRNREIADAKAPVQAKSPGLKVVPSIQNPADGQPLVRGGVTAGTPGQTVKLWNRWRENYNALFGLTISRVRYLLEMEQRGDTAYPQWTYRTIERRHPVLKALIDRCEAPIENFDWDVKPKKQLPAGYDDAAAKKQQDALKAAYAQIGNLRHAITHLAHADFPGYAHLQKHYAAGGSADGGVVHLECLYQYCVCRDGLFGDWFWNPDSRALTMPDEILTEKNRIGGDTLPRTDFIIRMVKRPINEIALENYVRRKLVEKDWSAFDEIFGIPSGVVTMPGGIPPEKVSEYEAAAKAIAEGGSGAMPNGSEYKPNDQPRDGSNLFKNHLMQLDEDLVLAATGGKLTMLVQQGSSSQRGSSKQHQDSFEDIARARANEVADCFRRDFDEVFLADAFPGQPPLVEFVLLAKDEKDIGELCQNVASLAPCGLMPDPDWFNEISGYKMIQAPTLDKANQELTNPQPGEKPEPTKPGEPVPASAPGSKPAKVKNRVTTPAAGAVHELAAAFMDDLEPLRHALASIESIEDPALFQKKLEEFIAEGGPLVKLLADINAYPKAAKVINEQTTQQLAAALKQKPAAEVTT